MSTVSDHWPVGLVSTTDDQIHKKVSPDKLGADLLFLSACAPKCLRIDGYAPLLYLLYIGMRFIPPLLYLLYIGMRSLYLHHAYSY